MKKKIIIFNIVLITLCMLALFYFGVSTNKASHYEEAEKEIKRIAEIYAKNYDTSNPGSIAEGVPEELRVTVISFEGAVIADSQDSSLVGTSHLNREEIISALSGEPKIVTRYSDSLKTDMMYYALKTDICVIRIAVPVENVDSYVIKTISTMVYVLLIALVVSYVAGIIFTSVLVKPLNDIKKRLVCVKNRTYGNAVPTTDDKEINEIITEINDLSDLLSENIKETNSEKERLNYLLSSISDGIVVADSNGDITDVNKVASDIFGVSEAEGKSVSVLTADKEFLSRIQSCLSGEETKQYELNISGKTYVCTFKKLETQKILVVLTDVTALKDGERTRAEFFANASHELKTPLTAVKGFNDIISMKTEEPETKKLSAKIDGEILRIISLINDMLGLSELESEKPLNPEKINLVSVAEEVLSGLSALAISKNVTVSIEGEGFAMMEKKHAVALIKNIVENGIRYNVTGGYVKITVGKTNGKTVLSVTDNGTGIEEEHLCHIFERFYRVCKSRSAEKGGTGLGLAIVKHICTLYGADVVVLSKYGEGTTVNVTFDN